jgi:hypothetical protein
MYSPNTVSLASKFDEVAKKNTEFFSRKAQEPIDGIRELLDVQCRIASYFVGWWLDPVFVGFRKGHQELMPLLFSLFHRNFFTFYSALMLTVSGFYESARPLLRYIFESLMVSKFCHICDDDRVIKQWDSGETIFFTNSILKKITYPDTRPFYEFWGLICEHSHATKASLQVSLELKSEEELNAVAVNLALLNALLECNYHLLNTHLITPQLAYMDKLYSNPATPKLRDYETPGLRKRAHVQFKKNRPFLGPESIKLISAYKRKWVIKK